MAAQNKTASFLWTEYRHGIYIFISVFSLLSIFSYHPMDASYFVRSHEMQNLFGRVGALFADLMWQVWGVGGPLFFVFAIFNVFLWRHRQQSFMIWLGSFQMWICSLVLCDLFFPVVSYFTLPVDSGGWVGSFVSDKIYYYLGFLGSSIFLISGIILSWPLWLGMSPVMIMESILKYMFLFISHLKKKEKKPQELVMETISVKEKESSKPSFIAVSSLEPSLKPSLAPFLENVKNQEQPLENILPLEPIGTCWKFDEFHSLVELLHAHKSSSSESRDDLERQRLTDEAHALEERLATFGVKGQVMCSHIGPVVNVHEFEPASGVKVSKVLGLQDDLALGLKAKSVLMAPMAGKSTIGIEVPAQYRETVSLKELLESSAFLDSPAALPMALGKLVDGSPLIGDLAAMPHLLVAGATGAGKSVGINVMLLSLMMRFTPKHVRFILVDPKMLELSVYDGVGHLLMPVVTDPRRAAGALKWVIDEMERRYLLMKKSNVRNIASFNNLMKEENTDSGNDENADGLPYIVVVIDELCDLMMTAPKDVEDAIQRIAQKARAAGIHLILATQRPSVDVLTGVIKANLPCRLSFQVASKHDSRTIIETVGADRLLGKGDMLFLPPGGHKLQRAQCAFVDDSEILSVTERIKNIYRVQYDSSVMHKIEVAVESVEKKEIAEGKTDASGQASLDDLDDNELYERVLQFSLEAGVVSTSRIQRHFRIGYNRAARLMDRLVEEGLVGPSDVAGKPREVLKDRVILRKGG